MVLGDKPAFDIRATSVFNTALLTSEMRQSPICGLIQFFSVRSQSSIVLGATGLRLRFRTCASQRFACCSNVTTFACCRLTTSLKYSTVSAPLSAMISRPRRLRSEADRAAGPAMGHNFARLSTLFSCPGTSIHHLTTHHLPLLSMWPVCPVRRDIDFPLRFTGVAVLKLPSVPG